MLPAEHTPEVIGRTPFAQLSKAQTEVLCRMNPDTLRRVIDVAAQEPPVPSTIAAAGALASQAAFTLEQHPSGMAMSLNAHGVAIHAKETLTRTGQQG